jgi:hypothetical protein
VGITPVVSPVLVEDIDLERPRIHRCAVPSAVDVDSGASSSTCARSGSRNRGSAPCGS